MKIPLFTFIITKWISNRQYCWINRIRTRPYCGHQKRAPCIHPPQIIQKNPFQKSRVDYPDAYQYIPTERP